MSNHVYKMVELVGTSGTGTDEAIRNAVTTASKTLRHVRSQRWLRLSEHRTGFDKWSPAGLTSVQS